MGFDGAGIDVTCKGVAPGMRFVETEHGYTFHREKDNLAVGWWPLLSRSDMEGTMTYQGKTASVKGLSYIERQLDVLGLMPHWSYGHFFAGMPCRVLRNKAAEKMMKRHLALIDAVSAALFTK